jgi:imidazolonepropionase-like amidohydrolase
MANANGTGGFRKSSGGIEIVDCGDATVPPGMVDAHCHTTLACDRRQYEEMPLDGDEMMALVTPQ